MTRRRAALFLILVCGLVPRPAAAQVSGNVRGVSLFYLDGLDQDIRFILDKSWDDDPIVKAKLDNLFAAYRTAGVNWVRLLIAVDRMPDPYPDIPTDPGNMIDRVNKFMRDPRAAGFKFELVFFTRNCGHFYDGSLVGYAPDKTWLTHWFTRLDQAHMGMYMLSGDLVPCQWNGTRVACYGEPDDTPLAHNHGHWIKAMWPWARATFPNLPINYEVAAGGGPESNFEQLRRIAAWVTANTPDVPAVAASLYLTQPPSGTGWVTFANQYTQMLNVYHSVTAKPLWIDEFGTDIQTNKRCQSPGARNECDQNEYYAGFLAATTCWTNRVYPKFAWLAGNDYPYVLGSWFGLFKGFDAQNKPVPRPAWTNLSLYYNLQQCPQGAPGAPGRPRD
jgi:hypothetical protein